jgi:hypothetical protein
MIKQGKNKETIGKAYSNALRPPRTLHVVPRSSIFWDTVPCSPLNVNQLRRWFNFNGLHGVISRKAEIFITAAVRTSNPTCNTRDWTRTSMARNQYLTSSAMARPWLTNLVTGQLNNIPSALCYKPKGGQFEPRWGRFSFHWPNPSCRTMARGSTQPLTEMSTRNLPGG